MPFLSLMQGSINIDVMAFLEKFFLYGGTIWLFAEAGLRLRPAALLVAASLFGDQLHGGLYSRIAGPRSTR